MGTGVDSFVQMLPDLIVLWSHLWPDCGQPADSEMTPTPIQGHFLPRNVKPVQHTEIIHTHTTTLILCKVLQRLPYQTNDICYDATNGPDFFAVSSWAPLMRCPHPNHITPWSCACPDKPSLANILPPVPRPSQERAILIREAGPALLPTSSPSPVTQRGWAPSKGEGTPANPPAVSPPAQSHCSLSRGLPPPLQAPVPHYSPGPRTPACYRDYTENQG